MISLTIWCNKHLERLQIAFARWAYAILLSLKNLLVLIIQQTALKIVLLPILISRNQNEIFLSIPCRTTKSKDSSQ